MKESDLPQLVREQFKQLVEDWEFQTDRIVEDIKHLDRWLLASSLALNLAAMGVTFGSDRLANRPVFWTCFWLASGAAAALCYALAHRRNLTVLRDYNNEQIGKLKQFRQGLLDGVPVDRTGRATKNARVSKIVHGLQTAPLLTFIIGCAIVGIEL